MKKSLRKVKSLRKKNRVNKGGDSLLDIAEKLNTRKIKRLSRLEKLRNWYKDLKKNKKCLNCGENNPVCLDFHHIDPRKKKLTISRMVSVGKSKNSILLELEKISCLCSNCHRKHHKSERVEKRNPSEIQKLIRKLKQGRKCYYCNESEICCLEFHHIEPEDKLFSIGNAIKMKISKEDILREVNKCFLICSNHHRILHNKESLIKL